MSQIKLNDKVGLDLAKMIPSKVFIYANSGYGKSWLERRILEDSNIVANKVEIAEATGYSLGGGFNNYISELTSKEMLIKIGNAYKVNPAILEMQ